MLKRHYLWLPLFAWMGMAHADSAEVKSKLESMMPGIKVENVQPLGNTGLYETIINGEIIYVSEDARYVFQGDVIDLSTRDNITENKRVKLRQDTLASLNEADMIVYEPKETKHTITVFTDIDCGYCRKLHNQMADYNALGIRVRYMAYPRAGLNSEAFDKAEEVWCSDNPKQAMTDAKNGTRVNSKECDAPIAAQYKLGGRLGVTGTPALFMESGEMLPGYVPPSRLLKVLDERASKG